MCITRHVYDTNAHVICNINRTYFLLYLIYTEPASCKLAYIIVTNFARNVKELMFKNIATVSRLRVLFRFFIFF